MGTKPIHDIAGTRKNAPVYLPVHAASDATISYAIFEAEGPVVVEKITAFYGLAITGADTNTHHVNVDKRTSAYVVSAEVAAKDFTNGIDAAVATPENILAAEIGLTDGQILSVEYEEIGTGGAVALGDIGFVVEWRPEG